MVCEGIVLGYKILQQGIVIDKAKIEVIDKLPPSTTIEDFSKISKPLCAFLKHNRAFMFDEPCVQAFEELKKQLVTTPIIRASAWTLPFKLMCDANDFAVGAMLGKKEG
ncbi:reverse transcriptase [Gossypium australe]|uniref:Reverse transcriptase n=1 Tax=Gossypium australe TaxID=47621 RepID=A0A5B6VC06_9ROSI|nr:reverse transcriptase [Gossypium australe]